MEEKSAKSTLRSEGEVKELRERALIDSTANYFTHN